MEKTEELSENFEMNMTMQRLSFEKELIAFENCNIKCHQRFGERFSGSDAS